MAEQITKFVLSHTNELCANVIPSMENSLLKDITSTVEIEDYTVTITISKKKSVLGKRRHTSDTDEHKNRNTIMKLDTSYEKLLYNSYGHNFLDMYS